MFGNWRGCQHRHVRGESRNKLANERQIFLVFYADGEGTIHRLIEPREPTTRTVLVSP